MHIQREQSVVYIVRSIVARIRAEQKTFAGTNRYAFAAADYFAIAKSKVNVLDNFDFEKLKNININEDIKKTKNFFETVYDLLQAMDLEKIDDVQTLLNDEEVTNKLSEALKLSNDSQLFKECFPKIVYYIRDNHDKRRQ